MSRLLVLGTFTTSIGLVVRAACQAATFLIIARTFGPGEYGQFVAIVCVGVLLAPVVTAGIEYVAVMQVATGRAGAAEVAGCALVTLALLGPPGVIAAVSYVHVVIDATLDYRSLLLLLGAEILLVPMLEIAWRVCQAHEQMGLVGFLRALPAMLKLGAATLFAGGVLETTLPTWAAAYCAATLLATATGMGLLVRRYGIARPGSGALRVAAAQGWSFAAYSIAERMTNDADKIVLSSLSGAQSVGLYSAAYRVIEVFQMPLMAMLMTFNAALYKAGALGRAALQNLMTRLAALTLLYGALAAGIVLLGARYLGVILGESFQPSVPLAVALAPLPLCYGLRVLFGLGLAALGHQVQRMMVQYGAAVLSVVLCLLAIGRYGVMGAVYATLTVEIASVIVMLVLLIRARPMALRAAG